MTKKAYSYIRFSTPEQMKGDSLRRQIEASREYAERLGFELDESLRDIGVSAYRGKNKTAGALSGFLKLIERGEIPTDSALLVESLDRLSRADVMSALSLFTSILSAGVEIHTLADGRIYTREGINDIGELIYSLMIMSRAHEESAMKSKRLSAAWANKKEEARKNKKPITKRAPAWLKLVDGKLEVIPERAEVVRRIFEMTVNGMGRQVIANTLNSERLAPWGKSKGWQESYIKKIIENRAVLGEYQPHKGRGKDRKPDGEPIPGFYPRIISDELFYRANSAKARRANGGGRRGKSFGNLFTGLVKCADCGASMNFRDKGKPPKGQKYLVCSNYRRGLGCKNSKHFRYDKFERVALLELATKVNWHSVVSGERTEADEIKNQLDASQAQLERANKRADTLLELLLESGESEQARVKERFKEAQQEAEILEREVAELETRLGQMSGFNEGDIKDTLNKAIAALDTEDDEQKRYQMRAAINETLKQYVQFFAFSNLKGFESGVLLRDGTSIPLVLAGDTLPQTIADFDWLQRKVEGLDDEMRRLAERMEKLMRST